MSDLPTFGGWPRDPVIHEVATWPWLTDLSRAAGRRLTLADVPAAAWDDLVLPGTDAVWLMGVWERSPAGRDIALADPALRAAILEALPDATDDDVVGSPYCIRRYEVDPHLGGRPGLAAARAQLAARGVRLVLDFVPNHVAPDHPWTTTHPGYFVHGTEDDLTRAPGSFLRVAGGVMACGRDPYFPAWPDVVQLDPTQPTLRDAVVETLLEVAAQCDGVRCDMAMLMLDEVVGRTWSDRVGPPPPLPYWTEVIGRVRDQRPAFLFMAEAYWDLESVLLAQGFDHCYDKRLYDRLVHDGAGAVRAHLQASPDHQSRLVRFLENHDEPRAASVLPPGRDRAAAVTTATLPGALLLYEGQLTGRRAQLPVQLGRRPTEPPDRGLEAWWRALLARTSADRLRTGRWSLLAADGWPDNRSCERLVAWQWEAGDRRHVVVVNLSDAPADGRLRLGGLAGRSVVLTDLLDGRTYLRQGDDLAGPGLYVALGPWGQHLFRLDSAT